MWVFYLISLPLTMGMVLLTLRYYAAPRVPRYVLFTVGYTWFSSLSIIILVPADIWTYILTIARKYLNGAYKLVRQMCSCTYVIFCRAVVPLIQGFEDSGDFTVSERLKTSLHLVDSSKNRTGGLLGFAMACSNTFGLVTGAFLLGFGLSEIPRSIWRNADWTTRQKVLSHKIAKMAVRLDNAHQELSNAIVVAQATSSQMSKRDPLRRYMDVIDDMLTRMFREDPSFKPQGGQLGGSDMDYDIDEKSMATLRRHLRGATEEYYRYKSEYMTYVLEALELEDKIKNYEHRNSTGCMIARYAPPISYNFLNLIRLGSDKTTIFEQRMGNIDNAVPFFGDKFNKIYPLIMVIYTLLVASNFFDRVFDFLGSWKRYVFETEAEDMDGFDPSGLIILQKERSWLGQGRNIGEQVVPLVRNFNGIDVESSDTIMVKNGVEMKGTAALVNTETNGNLSKTTKEETRRYGSSREAISSKYAAIRQQNRFTSKSKAEEENLASTKVSFVDHANTYSRNASGTSGLASKWQTMKTGFQSFRANIGGKGFLPIRETQGAMISRASSSESLDDIFQRLKQPALDHNIRNDDYYLMGGNSSGPSR
ncbi:hypothetical protein Fmac_004373 [Flemingia macrophylla]|uniref:LMBR1-like membrane protein n=1 Tax=Flemingia macrophylla TaxID=520843 RepID=A0ABD1N4Z3_9FABA